MKLASAVSLFALASYLQLCAGDGALRGPSPLAKKREDKVNDFFHRNLQEDTSAQVSTSLSTLGDSLTGLVSQKKQEAEDARTANDEARGAYADQVAGALSTAQDSVKVVQGCMADSSSCKPLDVANTVFEIVGTIGTVVGVGFPPAGLALAAVAAVGTLIAGIMFKQGFVSTLPGLDANAVENAVLRAISSYDAGTNLDFIVNLNVNVKAETKDNAAVISSIQKQKAQNDTKVNIDAAIHGWYKASQKPAWTEFRSDLTKVGASYITAFSSSGGGGSGARASMLKWMDECKKCDLYHYDNGDKINTGLLYDGTKNLGACMTNKDDAKSNFELMQNFYAKMVQLSISLTGWYGGAISIMGEHSTCDLSQTPLSEDCIYKPRIENLYNIISQNSGSVLSRVNILNKSMRKDIPETCGTDTNPASSNFNPIWPFNQNKNMCQDDFCAYKYMVVFPQSALIDKVNMCKGYDGSSEGCKQLDHGTWSTSDFTDACSNTVNRMYQARDTQATRDKYGPNARPFYNGVWGFHEEDTQEESYLLSRVIGGGDDQGDSDYTSLDTTKPYVPYFWEGHAGYQAYDGELKGYQHLNGDWLNTGIVSYWDGQDPSNSPNSKSGYHQCWLASDVANGDRDISSIAIPSFCPTIDMPECVTVFKDDTNFLSS